MWKRQIFHRIEFHKTYIKRLGKIIVRTVAALGLISLVLGFVVAWIDEKQECRKEEEDKNKHIPYGIYEKYFKRFLDFVFSFLIIVCLSPVFLIIAVMVKIKLGSPIIFAQERPGRNNRIFRLYKFRSMTEQYGEDGSLLPDEERLTGFGKMLRNSSLDEIPELYNILKGEMSLVGPRPLVPEYLPYYTEEERHRHDVRPGLTGLAQVNGRNALSWEKRFQYDCYYVRHVTLRMDVWILFRTIRKVFKKEDIVIRGTENSVLDFDEDRRKRKV